ncbi:MAG TPA: hypothetical protein PK440_14410 [Candidatus Accumulibacter phosphatis]|nr:MAG: hypothetical protein AW07_04217 [Candidatus Accumulibacter sp. SK-11]HCN69743.1 hypothetical protein [Accumulibacter sp.]HRL77661.1 hypothetical protein [Candidatus Accumulibacter phosphatis]HRQ96169.1 hypothetical protein [Candidatus Accumulibacter phosphatis]
MTFITRGVPKVMTVSAARPANGRLLARVVARRSALDRLANCDATVLTGELADLQRCLPPAETASSARDGVKSAARQGSGGETRRLSGKHLLTSRADRAAHGLPRRDFT